MKNLADLPYKNHFTPNWSTLHLFSPVADSRRKKRHKSRRAKKALPSIRHSQARKRFITKVDKDQTDLNQTQNPPMNGIQKSLNPNISMTEQKEIYFEKKKLTSPTSQNHRYKSSRRVRLKFAKKKYYKPLVVTSVFIEPGRNVRFLFHQLGSLSRQEIHEEKRMASWVFNYSH